MNQVIEHTDRLINVVRESKEYIQYQELLKKVQENAELYQLLSEYRKRSMFLQFSTDNNILDISNILYDEFRSCLNNSLAIQFLAAEQAYMRLIRQLNNRITENLDLDINFMED